MIVVKYCTMPVVLKEFLTDFEYIRSLNKFLESKGDFITKNLDPKGHI
jgi:hypothetical protein